MSHRKEFRDLSTPAAAREVIDGLEFGGGVETVPLADARGRVLAERIDADIDVPGFDRASMDGYAVRARDTFGADAADPAVLDVAGAVHAGEEPAVRVESGTATEISTGAVMPAGADAVVMVERTATVSTDQATAGDTQIAVETAVTPGENVMLAGADVAAGERALGPGTLLTPREIGLLSALGVADVSVRSKPTIGIVSTGDELVRPGGRLDSDAGQIYDVNSTAIASAVDAAGGEPQLYPHVGDDMAEMERVLVEAATECDLVLSSGSTSASAVDVVYRVIEERGELLLHGVAIKPGKPMLVGRIDDAAYVGLPGYPVSAMTIFREFVAGAIREAAGCPEPETATATGRMAREERFEEGRRRLVPVGIVTDGVGNNLVYPVDKGSGATTSLVDADGVVDVPPDVNYLADGESVTVDLFSADTRPPTLLGVGEDDPALARLLDRLDRPRYLSVGTNSALRWLRDDVPDIAVLAGPVESRPEGVELGTWDREWGLVVPPNESDAVTGLPALVDSDYRLVNRPTESGLRTALGNAIATLADDRGTTRRELTDAIDGYGFTARAVESPARKVMADDADAGVGLRATADRLGLGFVSLGTQSVTVLAAPGRRDKPAVGSLAETLTAADDVFEDLPGYRYRGTGE